MGWRLLRSQIATPAGAGDWEDGIFSIELAVGAGRQRSSASSFRVSHRECRYSPEPLRVDRLLVRNVSCQLADDKLLKEIDGGRFADAD